MRFNPYLNFNGQCEAAFRFYERVFGGKVTILWTFAESPLADDVPPGWGGKILHARLVVGDWTLMGGDELPEDYAKPQGFHVTLNPTDPVEAERLFAALAENGTVRAPLAPTFWAERFGMLDDQFGVPWMMNCEKHPE